MISLYIASVTFDLEVSDPSFEEELRTRYEHFLLPASPSLGHGADVVLHLCVRGGGRKETDDPRVEWADGKVKVEDGGFGIDAVSREGVVEGEGWCMDNPCALDTLLRVLLASLLARCGGMLVHGCAFSAGDAGCLLVGGSGAGKTTLCRRLDAVGVPVLTDEVSAVTSTGDGYLLWSTPFWGDFGRPTRSSPAVPLGMAGVLCKGEIASVERVETAAVVARMMSCLLCFEESTAAAAELLGTVRGVVDRVPLRRVVTALDEPVENLVGIMKENVHVASFVPVPARERIRHVRNMVRSAGGYPVRLKGGSMYPFFRGPVTVILERASASCLRVGDVVALWLPAERPTDDRLLCHRVTGFDGCGCLFVKGDACAGVERFVPGVHGAIVGRVGAVVSGEGVRRMGRMESLLGLACSVSGLSQVVEGRL